MKKQQAVTYGIGGLVIGVLIGVAISSSAVNTNNQGMMRMMGMHYSQGAMGLQDSGIDAHFIEQMIPHHEDAITMANLALQRAKRKEIKTLAENIISAQQNEINTMSEWYTNWFGRKLPSGADVMNQHGMMSGDGMHMGMMGDERDNAKLEAAQDFDKAFIEEMIPHHQMAVMMASMLKGGTQRPEMKQLADDIITAQTDEIGQMRSWYSEWYK